jgi:hypothetical protein
MSANRQKFVHFVLYCSSKFWLIAIRRDHLANHRRYCPKVDKILSVFCCPNAQATVSVSRARRRSFRQVLHYGRYLYFRNKWTFGAKAISQGRSALASGCGLCHFRHFPAALDAIAGTGTEAPPRLKEPISHPGSASLVPIDQSPGI